MRDSLTCDALSLTLTRTQHFDLISFCALHQNGETALVCAADGGSVATAILLLDRGADINQKDTVSYNDSLMQMSFATQCQLI